MSLTTNLLLALALTSGSAMATEVPTPISFPEVNQLKTVSVQHWSVIADELARTTLASLGSRAANGIYISDAGDSAFDESLHTFLIDSFHKAGAKVLAAPHKGALVLDFDSVITAHLSKADPSAVLPMLDRQVTRTELTVTVSVTGADDTYLARQSHVYYVNNADSRLYHSAGKTLHIKGGN